MGWRFRRSFKVIPGVRLNLSKSGLSCSIGGAPLTLNVGPRGVYGTASLPGSGISFRRHFGNTLEQSHQDSNVIPLPPSVTPSLVAPHDGHPAPHDATFSAARIEEIQSASTELMTSASLKELKQLIHAAYEEHEDISAQLNASQYEKGIASQRYLSWANGFLLRRVFKKTFGQRRTALDTAEAKVAELQEQLKQTTIATHIEINREQAEPYFKMRDEFIRLLGCAAIWDVKSQMATDKFRERTTADSRLDRQKVTFSISSSDLIQWEQKVPYMQNANGGEIFFYPGFILYRAAKTAFSVIDFHDLNGSVILVKFFEEQGVPPDSQVIGQTWAKCNKDGSRDKRFVNNYQIPIALYGSWTLKSDTGLWEQFQFSNPERLQRFANAMNAFIASFDGNPEKPQGTN